MGSERIPGGQCGDHIQIGDMVHDSRGCPFFINAFVDGQPAFRFRQGATPYVLLNPEPADWHPLECNEFAVCAR